MPKIYLTLYIGLLFCATLTSQISIGIKGYSLAWPNFGDTVLPEDAET